MTQISSIFETISDFQLIEILNDIKQSESAGLIAESVLSLKRRCSKELQIDFSINETIMQIYKECSNRFVKNAQTFSDKLEAEKFCNNRKFIWNYTLKN